ncbi:MAG: HDIG domain-containing protein [Candidatus Krumholzibacteria bacterium]|nr:HDIG domain-containing protein [Candidatus Krumholzibacteria bacterium]
MKVPPREAVYALLTEFTQNPSLVKHALAVEAAMRLYAERLGGDPDAWGAVGLIHDFDYERYPSLDDHPFKGAEILRARGYDEELIQTVLSHANHAGVARDTPIRKALFAVDELCGLVTAVALVRPSKSLAEVETKSVKKKLKDKAFARNVDRDDIRRGAELLGLELDAHIGNVVAAMKRISAELEL